MQFLMLFNPDFAPFDPNAVERAFRLSNEFTELRLDEPGGGALIECEYIEPDDRTIIRLSRDASTVSIDHTWGAALRALLVQSCLGVPLRMVNDDNTFDLTFSDISTIEGLEAAMESPDELNCRRSCVRSNNEGAMRPTFLFC